MTMILTSVTMVGWAAVPDSDRGDFRRPRAVDISSSKCYYFEVVPFSSKLSQHRYFVWSTYNTYNYQNWTADANHLPTLIRLAIWCWNADRDGTGICHLFWFTRYRKLDYPNGVFPFRKYSSGFGEFRPVFCWQCGLAMVFLNLFCQLPW